MIRRTLILVSIICCLGYAGHISVAQVEYEADSTDNEAVGTANVTNNTMNAETGDPEMMNAEIEDPEMMERMNAEIEDPEMMERMNAEIEDPEMMNANNTNTTG